MPFRDDCLFDPTKLKFKILPKVLPSIVRLGKISTTTAHGGGAAPGASDKILEDKTGGAVVVEQIAAPSGPDILSTATAPDILSPTTLSGAPGAAPNPPGRWWWISTGELGVQSSPSRSQMPTERQWLRPQGPRIR